MNELASLTTGFSRDSKNVLLGKTWKAVSPDIEKMGKGSPTSSHEPKSGFHNDVEVAKILHTMQKSTPPTPPLKKRKLVALQKNESDSSSNNKTLHKQADKKMIGKALPSHPRLFTSNNGTTFPKAQKVSNPTLPQHMSIPSLVDPFIPMTTSTTDNATYPLSLLPQLQTFSFDQLQAVLIYRKALADALSLRNATTNEMARLGDNSAPSASSSISPPPQFVSVPPIVSQLSPIREDNPSVASKPVTGSTNESFVLEEIPLCRTVSTTSLPQLLPCSTVFPINKTSTASTATTSTRSVSPSNTTDENNNKKRKSPSNDVAPKVKICRMDSCHEPAAKRTPYCSAHSGPRRCEKDGCTKCAQGRTRFCIAHGGGRRCSVEGCTKGARDRLYCAAHGGGRRCSAEGCAKLAVDSRGVCTAHGGGRRCQYGGGCPRSAQSNTNFCVRHGGGRKCSVDGCNKVARGRSGCCMVHSKVSEKQQDQAIKE